MAGSAAKTRSIESRVSGITAQGHVVGARSPRYLAGGDASRVSNAFTVCRQSTQSDQQVDTIAISIGQFQQRRNRIVRITAPELSLKVCAFELFLEGSQLRRRYEQNCIRIDACPDQTMHGSGHRTNDRVIDRLRAQYRSNIHQQQSRFTWTAGSHGSVRRASARRRLPASKSATINRLCAKNAFNRCSGLNL
jgi:hypothetical protein